MNLGACITELFTVVIYGFHNKLEFFFSGKPFHPSLMFVGKAISLP